MDAVERSDIPFTELFDDFTDITNESSMYGLENDTCLRRSAVSRIPEMATWSRPDVTAGSRLVNGSWSKVAFLRPRRPASAWDRSTSNPVSFPESICSNGTKPGLIATRRVPPPAEADEAVVDEPPHPAIVVNAS